MSDRLEETIANGQKGKLDNCYHTVAESCRSNGQGLSFESIDVFASYKPAY